MKNFKVAPAQGEESTTDEVYVDAAGKAWPVYTKRILVGALPNATTKNTAHGISNIKLDGGFRVLQFTSDNGTNSWDERTGSNALVSITATNLVVVTGADLSTHLRGLATIAYCKTTD